MSQTVLTQYDPDIGYTFIPLLKMRVAHESGGYLVATNSLGFRSGEIADDGRPNIFVFGDSFTAGDGVSNGKRWTDALARAFPGYAIHNFGLPGTGTDQHWIAWRKFAMARACDLLIVAVLVENIRRITSAYRPVEAEDGQTWFKAKPYFLVADETLVRHHDPVPAEPVPASALDGPADNGGRFPLLRRMVSQFGLKGVLQQLTSYQPVPDYDDPSSEGWTLMRAILSQWSEERAGAMAIIPLPLYQHIEETADATAYQQRFADLAIELDRPVIDPLPAMRRYSPADRRAFRFKRDVHLTPAGHEALAAAIAPPIGALIGGRV